MRGSDEGSGELFSYVNLKDRVPGDHPLRAIRGIAKAALHNLSGDFAALYSFTCVSGHAERLAGLEMIQAYGDRLCAIALGADKRYAADFVEELRTMNVRPHVAQNSSGRRSAIDKRITRHPGYAASQRIRKRIGEAFGWTKIVGGLRKTKLRGLPKVDWAFTFAAAAYNLVRLPKLMAQTAT